MRLAHISDLHILDLHGVSPKRFLSRRVLGGAHLLVRRAREHLPELLENLAEDLLKEEPDHIVITGDLSNLALESEFERVFQLIKLLGGYSKLSVVPGNHDYYTTQAADNRRFEKFFSPFMFRREFSDLDVDVYPYTKQVGELYLVGVNSATRTVPPLSYGTIGDRQLELIDKRLGAPERQGHLTCLFLHHALHTRDFVKEATSGLLNRDRLLDLIQRHRVDLVLYGHDHVGRTWKQANRGHSTLFVCCGSSTRLTDNPSTMARYRLITVDHGRIRRVDTKVFDAQTRRFVVE